MTFYELWKYRTIINTPTKTYVWQQFGEVAIFIFYASWISCITDYRHSMIHKMYVLFYHQTNARGQGYRLGVNVSCQETEWKTFVHILKKIKGCITISLRLPIRDLRFYYSYILIFNPKLIFINYCTVCLNVTL